MDLQNLEKVLTKYNIPINPKQLEQFGLYYENLMETNKIHNLTSITEENEVIYKHFLDSVIICNQIPDSSKIIDIGCGAGFPSIPLKIINNSLQITAIDSVGKKINFVQDTINKLNLNNSFYTIHTRIEELAHKNEFREKYDIVVSRAVAPLNIILEYSAPFLKNDGYIYSYKGSGYIEELKNSENALKTLNCKVEEIIEYNIDEIQTKRYLIKIKKLGDISTKYPRAQNKPRISPL